MFKIIFLNILVCCLFCNCYNTKWTTIPDKMDIPFKDTNTILHQNENEMILVNAQILEDKLHGYATSQYSVPSKPKEVHIYFDSSFVSDKKLIGNIRIPSRAIHKVRIKERIAKPISTGLAVGGIVGGGGMMLLAIAAAESFGGSGFFPASDVVPKVTGGAAFGAGIGAMIGSIASAKSRAEIDSASVIHPPYQRE